jgi:PAS domain S-box-containing protein
VPGEAITQGLSRALLDALFSSSPVGLAFFDRELRFVRINDALAEASGIAADDHVGRPLSEMRPDLEPAVLADLRRVLETGESVTRAEIVRERPQRRSWLASYHPVRDGADGEIVGVVAVAVEETERLALLASERGARERAERAERRAAFLARAGEVLSGSLNYAETLRRVARAAVPNKADWCVVDMLGADGALQRLAVAHADPAKERWAWELHERYPPDPAQETGVFAVMRSGVPELYRTIPDELVAAGARDPEHLKMLRDVGISAAMIVPLTVRGEPVGALSFIRSGAGRGYDETEFALLQELGRRASVAIENAHLYRERSHVARTLQRSLLPPRLPDVEGLDIAARYRPAGEGSEVGGDFYDVFDAGAGEWALVVGDVCGKGPEAAALTSLARYSLRAAALVRDTPGAVLEMTNEAVLREHQNRSFVSAVHAWLRPDDRSLRLASAGHPAALVVRVDGTVEPVKPAGPLLGVVEGARYEDAAVRLHAGDCLLLYTDGVLESGAPAAALDLDALAEVAARAAGGTAAELAETVEAEALRVADGTPRDDMAILAVRCLP